MQRGEESGELSDPEYRAVQEYGLPLVRAIIEGLFETENLDAIVYPTSPRRPSRIDAGPNPNPSGAARRHSPSRYANLTAGDEGPPAAGQHAGADGQGDPFADLMKVPSGANLTIRALVRGPWPSATKIWTIIAWCDDRIAILGRFCRDWVRNR